MTVYKNVVIRMKDDERLDVVYCEIDEIPDWYVFKSGVTTYTVAKDQIKYVRYVR